MTLATDNHASYKLFERALAAKGYRLDFDVTPPATATYVSPGGAKWATRAGHIAYPFNSELVRYISINKDETYGFAAEHGFPVPFTATLEDAVISEAQAKSLFKRYKTLIVKPADSLQSRGLTLGITTYDQLLGAVAAAKQVSPRVLVQEEVAGEEIRFTLMNGKVEAALLRRTPRVVGDGTHTIAELIEHENEERRQIRLEYITYPQLDSRLVPSELLASTRVPTLGETVELSKSTMIMGGCSVYNVLDQVDESYVRAIENLTAELEAGFMVADVFCQDFTQPAAADNYQLIEFNTAPALKLYYGCRDGKQFDIATRLAAMIDDHLQR